MPRPVDVAVFALDGPHFPGECYETLARRCQPSVRASPAGARSARSTGRAHDRAPVFSSWMSRMAWTNAVQLGEGAHALHPLTMPSA